MSRLYAWIVRGVGGIAFLAISHGTLRFLHALGVEPELWIASVLTQIYSGSAVASAEMLVAISWVIVGLSGLAGLVFAPELTTWLRDILARFCWAIKWDFDKCLVASVSTDLTLRHYKFVALGRNRSRRPLSNLGGHVRSLSVPKTLPLATDGPRTGLIPIERAYIECGGQFGVIADFGKLSRMEFLRDFGKFEFVFLYNGKRYRKKFGRRNTEKLTIDYMGPGEAPGVGRVL